MFHKKIKVVIFTRSLIEYLLIEEAEVVTIVLVVVVAVVVTVALAVEDLMVMHIEGMYVIILKQQNVIMRFQSSKDKLEKLKKSSYLVYRKKIQV